MRDTARWAALIVGMAAATLSLAAAPYRAAAEGVWSGPPTSLMDSAPDTTTEPEAPEVTVPEPSTATTEPADSTPQTSADAALVGAGDPDSDVDTPTAAIAVVGFIALLVLAGWWMVRRSDPDAAPMPPPPPTDLI